MALISLQNVSLSFGGLPVLDGISMQIEAGERVCLVGRNGEGKSSLMRLIAGEQVQ
ncbi:MAG: ATP-binding cassette domain-containing protein, partial [Desulfobulbaceae bacterium]|nr:ATP-binding cassette domain-containing protein [Desulfobulbaceae bacterium]